MRSASFGWDRSIYYPLHLMCGTKLQPVYRDVDMYVTLSSYPLARSAATEGGLATATNSSCDLTRSWQRNKNPFPPPTTIFHQWGGADAVFPSTTLRLLIDKEGNNKGNNKGNQKD